MLDLFFDSAKSFVNLSLETSLHHVIITYTIVRLLSTYFEFFCFIGLQWFRSGDVFESSHLHDAHHGAEVDELGHLNADFLSRLLRGRSEINNKTA